MRINVQQALLCAACPSGAIARATKYVDVDFAGLAFELNSLVEYATYRNGSVNQFSLNLMDAIYSRTGGKPLIRLGGTSADYAHYLPGQKEAALPPAEVDTFQNVGNTTIGPSYWELTKNFPSAKYIVQVPMAITNISEAVAWARAASTTMGMDRIHSFEPGNEADLYPDGNPMLQPPKYQGHLTNETYVGNYTKYVTAVAKAVNVPRGPFFQAFDTSAHIGPGVVQDSYIFDIPKCFGLGINKGNIVKTVAHHYYQTGVGHAADLASGLMNHSTIAGHMDLFRPAIDFLAQHYPHIPYILSEVGNSLNSKHDYDYQATLGSALWQVDFQLYGLSIGIDRFNFQQIMHSGFDLWLPVESAGRAAQVYSNFYAQPFVADFVGSSGKTTVSVLDVAGTGSKPNLMAYGAKEGGVLKRVAVVNLNYWAGNGTRGSNKVKLSFGKGVKSVRVEHLNSPQGASAQADSMSYAGSQWTYESLGKEVKGWRKDGQMLRTDGGVLEVDVALSEAVMIHLTGC